MKSSILFIASKSDPNGLTQLKSVVDKTLEHTSEDLRIIIISEDSKNLLTDFSGDYKNRIDLIFGNFKNFSRAILYTKESGLLDVDLLFIPAPGDDILITGETISAFQTAYKSTKAGFIISDHYEYDPDDKNHKEPVIQHLKPCHDPSKIIVPGRANNPMLFSHGSLVAVSKPFINDRVFDDEVNFGTDYAIRMGVLSQDGKLFTIPYPTYTYKRGLPYYPGEGLQDQFTASYNTPSNRHFSYTQDPARFEWGPISFQKYLKDIGAFLPDSYFSRKVIDDPTLGNGISFVVPTYNREQLIKYAIDSVIEVRDRVDVSIPIEMLIVDNGSDNTANVVAPYAQQHPDLVKFFKVFGLTLGGARNYGIEKASNRIIGQLDSDDVLTGDPITGILEQFNQTGAAAIIGIYQTASRNSETGELRLDHQIVTHDEYLCYQKNPLLQMCIPGPGAPRYYRKEAVLTAGGFPDLLYGEDGGLSDQMLKQGFLIERNVDNPTYIAVRHTSNTDSETLDMGVLIKKNYAKYSFKIAIIEEIKHLVLSNNSYHKYNNRVGF